MKFCRNCLYGDTHPLGITFDESGLCSGCQIHREKYQLDWDSRLDALKSVVRNYRRATSRSAYDCIVPVTGGGDTFFVLHIVKNVLGLNPLGVHFNPHFNTKTGIENLARCREAFDLDVRQLTLDPLTFKKITRQTLAQIGSLHWPVLAGQSTYPVQVAVQERVPLIIWGAHEGIEQVGMASHIDGVEMTRRYRDEHHLMGITPDMIRDPRGTVEGHDLEAFAYPDETVLFAHGIRGIYLSNYIPWDPYKQNLDMAVRYGRQSLIHPRSLDRWDHSDSSTYLDFHDVLKLVKHGYSKVTDQACREIRHGRLTRQEASEIVVSREAAPPEGLRKLCQWLGASPRTLDLILLRNKNEVYFGDSATQLGDFTGWSVLRGDRPAGRLHLSEKGTSSQSVFPLYGTGYPRTPSQQAAVGS